MSEDKWVELKTAFTIEYKFNLEVLDKSIIQILPGKKIELTAGDYLNLTKAEQGIIEFQKRSQFEIPISDRKCMNCGSNKYLRDGQLVDKSVVNEDGTISQQVSEWVYECAPCHKEKLQAAMGLSKDKRRIGIK